MCFLFSIFNPLPISLFLSLIGFRIALIKVPSLVEAQMCKHLYAYQSVCAVSVHFTAKNSQLEKTRGQECSSIGKLWSCSWHSALIVILETEEWHKQTDWDKDIQGTKIALDLPFSTHCEWTGFIPALMHFLCTTVYEALASNQMVRDHTWLRG